MAPACPGKGGVTSAAVGGHVDDGLMAAIMSRIGGGDGDDQPSHFRRRILHLSDGSKPKEKDIVRLALTRPVGNPLLQEHTETNPKPFNIASYASLGMFLVILKFSDCCAPMHDHA